VTTNVGPHVSKHGLGNLGIQAQNTIIWNETQVGLYQMAVERKEGDVASGGPLVVTTGKHTGRSAGDKFIVKNPGSEANIWWGNNKSMESAQFEVLLADMQAYAADQPELWVHDLFAGADLDHRLPSRIVTQHAWHGLFIRHLLIEPDQSELEAFVPEFNIIHMPDFHADPARHGTASETVIAVDFDRQMVLIAGTTYAGEIKKSVFSMLNYLLPAKGIMPMHCSVNVGDTDDAAVFFGLSGTGKTTLSADPSRTLIGDDEHGWSENGVFNFEGGCYAKMIKLSEEAEPEIFATTKMFGTVLENVVMDPITRVLDLDDNTLAENSRAAYSLSAIPNASATGRATNPKSVIMLTADAFGVLPPISRMTPSQAMYHFLSGYTAKVAGTEKGLGNEPVATFSTCFGAPFMPRHPSEYGNLLRDLIAKHNVSCWLVNTGWTGGPHGVGHRMPIKETRALLSAALDGSLNEAEFRRDANFGFEVPVAVPGVDTSILDPRGTWADTAAYDAQAQNLVSMFIDNFEKFEAYVSDEVKASAPTKAA
jgi:phosphoenolpyruvate carboxykinase (ATP)